MNNTDFFANPLQTIHFLSVFTSINTLGKIFYNQTLLTNETLFEPIPIVNSLCHYLNKNNDSAIIALGHKLLNNSDLYGSVENETIHLAYVNAMMDHIIASTVFAKFANTLGYLAYIVHSTNNLTLSFVERKIVQDLKNQRYLNEAGTISNLTDLTIKRVTEKLVFPFFPKPENDMQIINEDYIYAQAGLMLVRIARLNPQNFSFDEYITMAQTVEQGVLQGAIDKEGLKIFQIPALLYYTYKKRELFKKEFIKVIITREELWQDAFHLLFTDLNVTYEKTNKLQEENPAYQFHMAYSDYKHRTKLAEDTYRKWCPLETESDYATEVRNYKYYYSNSCCKTDKKKVLPNINEIFDKQNKRIADKYFLLEKALIREAFPDYLIKFIEQPNVTVFRAEMQRLISLSNLPVMPTNQKINLNDSIDLLAMKPNSKQTFLLALLRTESGITLLSTKVGMDLFLEKIGLKKGTKFMLALMSPPLKTGLDTFDQLAINIAKPREERFLEMLKNTGYDSTTGEKVVEFFENLIPFYPCVKASETGKREEIVLSCLLDAITIIPLVGEATSIGVKFINAAVKPLLLSVGTSLETFVARQSINLALKSGIRVLASEGNKEFSKIISRELFKDMGIAVLRTLDPGLELSYIIGKAGIKAIVKCFSIVGRIIPSLGRVVESLKNLKQTLVTKVVGTFENHNVFVNSISSDDGYGIKYVQFKEKTVELRRVLGYKSEQPVVLINDAKKGKRLYQIIDIKTGEPKGQKLEVRNDVLQVSPSPFAVRMKNLKEIGLSGRGKLPKERKADKVVMLATRENAVNILMVNLNENTAKNTLSQYVLEERGKTPIDFAIHWLLRNELPEWSRNLKLNDVKLYESLRFDENLEKLDLTEEMAANSITDFYGHNYVTDVIRLNPRELFRTYSHNQLHSIISFTDYYALENWRQTGISRISMEVPEGWQMRGAFCRLAIRQADDSVVLLPRKLYSVERMNFFDYARCLKGNIITMGKVTGFYTEISTSVQSLIQYGHNDVSLKVLFELNFDDAPYWAANLEQVFPNARRKFAFLPGTKFIVKKTDLIQINNVWIKKVHMKYVPLDLGKSEALAKLTNSAKMLNDWESQFYLRSVLDDFNLDLLPHGNEELTQMS